MLLTTVAATSGFFKRKLLVMRSRVHPNLAPPQRTHRVFLLLFCLFLPIMKQSVKVQGNQM